VPGAVQDEVAVALHAQDVLTAWRDEVLVWSEHLARSQHAGRRSWPDAGEQGGGKGENDKTSQGGKPPLQRVHVHVMCPLFAIEAELRGT
jgi:hypothetical protein